MAALGVAETSITTKEVVVDASGVTETSTETNESVV
jgi:hypothetical protein